MHCVHLYYFYFFVHNQEFLKLKDTELKVKILPLLLKRIVIKDAKLMYDTYGFLNME